MRKWITFLMTFLASASCANAYVNDGEVNFEIGYRHDNIRWSAKIPSRDPLFRASTKFEDLDILQIGVNGRGSIGCNLYLRGSADWGWVLDGNTKDKFEIFNPPSGSCIESFAVEETLIAKHKNITDGRHVFDISGAVGYPFYFCGCSMTLAPVVGYSFSEQNLWVESDQDISLCQSSGSRFFAHENSGCCCRDKFVARWYGAFIGLDWDYYPCGECWNLYASLEFHWANHQSKRQDRSGFSGFDHFKHTTHNAHAWVCEVGFDYEVCNCWTVGLNFKAQDWHASKHHHDNGNYSTDHFRAKTNWNSYAINLTVGKAF
jgi:hypothetical protein